MQAESDTVTHPIGVWFGSYTSHPANDRVNPGRDQGVHIDHSAVVADFDRERVEPHQRCMAQPAAARETP